MIFHNKTAGAAAGTPEDTFSIPVNEDFTNMSKIRDIGRWHVTNFVKFVSESVSPGAIILDAGAGECAYKRYFSHCEYVSVDLAIGEDRWNYNNLNYIAPLDNLPFDDASFDAILNTQVLEHLEYPRLAVKELFRVLKPGGKLFLTAPMAHEEHQVPYDFFRYTSYGLKSICDQAGFSEIIITPMGGMFTRWAYEIPRIMSLFPSAGIKKGKIKFKGFVLLPLRLVCFLAVRLTQMVFLWIDQLDKEKKFPFGWSLIAQK
ncbi:class I SAM-dependent methyltransferase [Desulfotruncus alcoholivorax]|uniref:class I SAM-dependent methyltransferase n=1 Tax=Desulfotruncus alcoholivorax TaxID=265477 RepID=UPI0003F525EC|nr:class I SAM-dependent methyltransferase [Desulfotruncus alcoholivorax]